jgi:hypothetical protein
MTATELDPKLALKAELAKLLGDEDSWRAFARRTF